MSSIANTAFEVAVSNITRNNIQNVPGYFGSGTGSNFVADICPAGFLVVRSDLSASEGYEGLGANGADILNGNTWRFVAAANGNAAAGRTGDHTGIFAFNTYDVNEVAQGNSTWKMGANTLGLELPKGVRGDFTELIVGEQYAFGAGNFSTLPATAATDVYVTIANGLLVASATEPARGTGVYLRIWRKKDFTVGARAAGFSGYVCEVLRTAQAAASGD